MLRVLRRLPTALPTARRTAMLPGAAARRSLFIQTESTPNPESLKFLPGKPVLESGTAQFRSYAEAQVSPLAKRLFKIEGVKSVFFAQEFITITKDPDTAWSVVKPHVFSQVMDFYAEGGKVLDDVSTGASDTAITDDDSEIVAMIKELIETRVRPSVQDDGGDIVFKSFNEESGVVLVQLQGSCSGCPSSTVTLKSGIENMMMHYIPEVTSVESIDEDEDAPEEEDLSPTAAPKLKLQPPPPSSDVAAKARKEAEGALSSLGEQ
ncbi:scaffold protein Nfu/NifU N terminal-domain-containing protein [Pavlovales sp. CCMP2436]|nr:scaffold protein Nfu/NifU N terminal-domain-containing protein [Pavlovales sp. CCMP2436]|mmetsp:Transcript_24883/g.63052  ORF Transcript_24883/g.63052 Transcript_24883/m.63052 type:complete len:265 (+) Transcript_24883:55-849(+)